MFGGNLDLSVVMTFISTFSAFFMMPLWMLCLGEKYC
jgi:predicted Na+-dependent transporter